MIKKPSRGFLSFLVALLVLLIPTISQAKSHHPTQQSPQRPISQTQHQVNTPQAYTVNGVITDENGNTLPNVTVTFGNYSVRTNGNGYFSINIPASNYNISAFKEGYKTYSMAISVSQNVTCNMRINAIKPKNVTNENTKSNTTNVNQNRNRNININNSNNLGLYKVTIFVSDSHGISIPGAQVSFANLTGTTNKSGTVTFQAHSGSYNVMAQKAGYNAASSHVIINQNQDVHLSIKEIHQPNTRTDSRISKKAQENLKFDNRKQNVREPQKLPSWQHQLQSNTWGKAKRPVDQKIAVKWNEKLSTTQLRYHSANKYTMRPISDPRWNARFRGVHSYYWHDSDNHRKDFFYHGKRISDAILFYNDANSLVGIGFMSDGEFVMIRSNNRQTDESYTANDTFYSDWMNNHDTNSAAADNKGDWAFTTNNYKVWNESSDMNLKVTWTGDVDDDGYITGNGTLEWYDTDWNIVSRYEGSMQNGMRNGYGQFVNSAGDHYDGNWVDDMRTGTGTYTWKNGNRYEGEFLNNQLHGNGILYDSLGNVIEKGQWDHDHLVG